MTNDELRLLRRAVRNGWDIPEEVRSLLPLAMVGIVADKGERSRNKIGAARVLVQMEGQNIQLNPPIQKQININATADLTEDELDRLIREEQSRIEALQIGETEDPEGEASGAGDGEDAARCADDVRIHERGVDQD